MPQKKSDSTIVAEIREVLDDMSKHFKVKDYKTGAVDDLGSNQSTEFILQIITDLVTGKQGPMTRDYLRTKKEASKTATTPAP